MASEKLFENKIKKYLTEKGAYFIKTHGDRFSKIGTPDLLICYRGKFIGVEVKAQNGHPSELQLYHLREIEKAGGVSFLLYPKDFDKFKKFIESC